MSFYALFCYSFLLTLFVISCIFILYLSTVQQPGIALPTTLATTQTNAITYPAARPAAVGPPTQVGVGSLSQQQSKVFTGVVTKMHENFGFIDDEVFFQIRFVGMWGLIFTGSLCIYFLMYVGLYGFDRHTWRICSPAYSACPHSIKIP